MTHSRSRIAVFIAIALSLTACHKETFEDHQQQEFAETMKKAEGGDVQSIYQTASAYESGSGVTQDYAKAMEWYKKGADKGDNSCMFNIAIMYREGRGVPKDMNQTVEWLLKSADAGAGVAWYNLGMMYYKGDEIPRNDAEALKWLKKYVAASGSSDPLMKPAADAIADIESRK